MHEYYKRVATTRRRGACKVIRVPGRVAVITFREWFTEEEAPTAEQMRLFEITHRIGRDFVQGSVTHATLPGGVTYNFILRRRVRKHQELSIGLCVDGQNAVVTLMANFVYPLLSCVVE